LRWILVCIQGVLQVAYFPYVGFNATQKTGQKTSNIVQVIEFAILRVRVKINLQILSVEAPGWQGAKVQEYQAYSDLSQRSQAGCIGA